MTDSYEIEQVIVQVRAAAEVCGAMVINAALSYEGKSVPVAVLAANNFPRLVELVRPKIVYEDPTVFDAHVFAKEFLSTEEEFVLDSSQIGRLISKWKKYDGDTCGVTHAFIHEGVIHGANAQVSWLVDFDTEARMLVDEIEGARVRGEQDLIAGRKRQLQGKVKELMADHRFSAGRAGFAKRTVLAEALFPDLDAESIRMVVEQAESEHWLSTASRKP